MQKEQLFESIDMLGSPYEAFLFDTDKYQLPTMSHWHYFMEIIFLVEGTVFIDCDNSDYCLKAGDMLLIYPRMMHAIYAATQERIRYYVLKFDICRLDSDAFSLPKFSILLENVRRDKSIPNCIVAEDINNFSFAECFTTCVEELMTKNFGYDLLTHSAIYILLTKVIRYWKGLGFDIDNTLIIDNNIQSINTILEYIDAHATEKLTVANLAEMCNISYSFFAKKFKELYGHSCKEYIEFVRICKAEKLLLFSNNDLSTMSQEIGFSDCSHFIKAFKKYKGITPKQYVLHNQIK